MSYLFNVQFASDPDGNLGAFESNMIPGFVINRVIYILGVPKDQERANHAFMNASFIYIALCGNVRMSVETDGEITDYCLNSPQKALYVSETSWVRAYDFSDNAVLLGFSDKKYEECEYINDYTLYRERIGFDQ